jgi:Uma2 family endonuclease
MDQPHRQEVAGEVGVGQDVVVAGRQPADEYHREQAEPDAPPVDRPAGNGRRPGQRTLLEKLRERIDGKDDRNRTTRVQLVTGCLRGRQQSCKSVNCAVESAPHDPELAMPTTLVKPRPKVLRIGPADHGRRMSLDQFESAVGQEGFVYELNKGVIDVTNIPDRRHFARMLSVRNQLIAYQLARPEKIHAVSGSFDNKLLIGTEESERHPDISVYLSPMPDVDEIWSVWVPAIAVEIVSESSAVRDYQEKPPEYLAFGVQEYWIVDGFQRRLTVMSRYRGQWREKVVKPTGKPYSTPHLPGFTLDLKAVFAA